MLTITHKIVNIEIRVWLLNTIITQPNMVNKVNVIESLWTVINISMVNVVHLSCMLNAGKVDPIVAIAYGLALDRKLDESVFFPYLTFRFPSSKNRLSAT